MRVGVDVRPALLGGTGVGRVARETWRALSRRDDVELAAWSASWARPAAGRRLAGVSAPRLPGRVVQALAPFGFGVETLLGPLDVFQHTDLVFPPVRRARQVLFVHDLHFLSGRGWHAPDFARVVGRRLAKACASAAALIVPSEQTLEDVRARRLVPVDVPVVLAVPGLDHVDPAPAPDDEDRVASAMARAGLPRRAGESLVLVPGTREPRKNQEALVRAFLGRPGDRGERLLLVGPPGWMVPGLEALLADTTARRDGRGDVRVAALGEASEADLAALLRRADVVAYPSLAEGFGLPAAEAMACGRAVLTSRGTPMAALGGDAVLAPDPCDPRDLARALAALLDDPGRRAELGERAAARVGGLTWEAHAEVLVSVYRGVLS